MTKYRKKPVVVEAIQTKWGSKVSEVVNFVGNENITIDNKGEVFIKTLEGEMLISPGDYVIKGVKGEFYPCKPDIFEATYESVETAQVPNIHITVNAVNTEKDFGTFVDKLSREIEAEFRRLDGYLHQKWN